MKLGSFRKRVGRGGSEEGHTALCKVKRRTLSFMFSLMGWHWKILSREWHGLTYMLKIGLPVLWGMDGEKAKLET